MALRGARQRKTKVGTQNSAAENYTRVFHVTGGNTNHYTTADLSQGFQHPVSCSVFGLRRCATAAKQMSNSTRNNRIDQHRSGMSRVFLSRSHCNCGSAATSNERLADCEVIRPQICHRLLGDWAPLEIKAADMRLRGAASMSQLVEHALREHAVVGSISTGGFIAHFGFLCWVMWHLSEAHSERLKLKFERF